MRIEYHLRKIEKITNSLAKLDAEQDCELVIEGYLLVAAHRINATMHGKGVLPQDKDIKHNRLFGFLKREKPFGGESDKLAGLVLAIESLRPSHVYGRGEDGNAARRAKECLGEIERICGGGTQS